MALIILSIMRDAGSRQAKIVRKHRPPLRFAEREVVTDTAMKSPAT
nr:hypothetical protein [Providencia stuartii]